MIKVGIDCGINNGFAVWNSVTQKFQTVQTLPLHKLFVHLNSLCSSEGKQNIKVFIENPNTWVPFGGRANKATNAKLQGAGAVKQTYKHIVEYLEDNGIVFVPIKLQGSLKKVTQEFFKQQTGWQETTNVHNRDAGMLVWSR